MKRGLATTLAALAMTGLAAAANAYCAGYDQHWSGYEPHYYSVAHEYHRSDFVVKARVLTETWIGENGKPRPLKPPFQNGSSRPWGFDPYLGAFYTVRVDQSLKGTPPATIKLFSENSTARFWLVPGSEILAFVSTERFDKPIGRQWTLDTCGNFATFPKARAILGAVVAQRKSP
jgi:hypothetical protein